MKCHLQQAFEHARASGAVAQKRQKALYDKFTNKPRLSIGDRVSLHNPAVKTGLTRKFHLPWKGPFTIVSQIDDVVFAIADSTGKVQTVHCDRLKLYTATPNAVAPSDLVVPPTAVPTQPQYHAEAHYDVQLPVVPQLLPAAAHGYGLRHRGNLQLPQRYR